MRAKSIVRRDDDGRKPLQQFAELVDRADRGRLGFEDLRALARAYRIHAAQLSRLRTGSTDPEQLRYLNALCVRAYAHVYVPPARFPGFRGFWLSALPEVLARTAGLQLVATLLLAFGALIGARLVMEDPANLAVTVPAAMYPPQALERLHDSAEARAHFLARGDRAISQNTMFAGALFANNTRVGLLSLATGILGGIPSVLLLLYNGLTLGGFAVVFLRGAERLMFITWILPHAIPELLAVILCSAGGIGLGLAAWAPGRLGRGAAMRRAGADALQLLLASLPLLIAAALIESFVRDSSLSNAVRFAVAAGAVAVLGGYLLLVRQLRRRRGSVDVSFLAQT